jgi:hypothetical protein
MHYTWNCREMYLRLLKIDGMLTLILECWMLVVGEVLTFNSRHSVLRKFIFIRNVVIKGEASLGI